VELRGFEPAEALLSQHSNSTLRKAQIKKPGKAVLALPG